MINLLNQANDLVSMLEDMGVPDVDIKGNEFTLCGRVKEAMHLYEQGKIPLSYDSSIDLRRD